ncbi:MAG: hypothetical protein A2X92_05310 [Syntrophus sp. GWC2_56_31]|nr:MAG: hypothetical protein A2X92_05310 [Syntrophus sp. GWC2_56_31]
MKTSSAWNFRSIVGKMMMGLVLAAMIGSIDAAPALGKDKRGKHDNGRYEHRGRGYDHDRRYYGQYGHRERVYYPPPPVIYAPPPPPGIGIFFPPIFFPPVIIRP